MQYSPACRWQWQSSVLASSSADALSFCVRNALTSDVDYRLCETIEAADLIVADADSAGVIEQIVQAARTPHVVFVGRTDVPGAANHVPRPIDPARVLRCLDEMAADVLRGAHRRVVRNGRDAVRHARRDAGGTAADALGRPHEVDPRINTRPRCGVRCVAPSVPVRPRRR